MTMTSWAHSVNQAGVRHALVDHLRGTAELAARFAEAFGAGDAGQLLGLAHDAGKASCAWQEGLVRAEAEGGRVGLDHKALGVYLAHPRLPIAQYILHGHHGGLTNREYVGQRLKDEVAHGGADRRLDAMDALQPMIPELFDTVPVSLPTGFEAEGTNREMLVRFLYSALVDADALDTAAHRLALPGPQVAPATDMGELWDRFAVRRKDLLAARSGSPIDQLREGVFNDCLSAATGPTGIYRLPAPTGSGKTLAAAGFALRHAALHGKSRVIVAVPYITITEQNAAVYRRLLNPEPPHTVPVVLEHHSSVDLDADPGVQSGRSWRRLAAENWDAPFVVTTTVQLFESLFARKPARMRKVHRLANAVIVLDEVQALPHLLLPPVLDALRVLTQRFGTTVLLASATQPQWWELSPLRDVQARDVIAEPGPLYAALNRVTYQWWADPKPSLAQVAARAANHEQALVVVNTVRDARTLATAVDEHVDRDGSTFHLSTAMCARHRRDVLAAVRDRLGGGRPVRLVSTQLIEAGVDVDSLQQAAGRANREGRLGPGGGLVVIFDPEDGGQPPAYRTQVGVMRTHMGPDKADPDDLGALAATYRDVYRALDVEGPRGRGAVIQANREALDFLAVTDGPQLDAGGKRDRTLAFRLIDQDTVPVVVPYGTGEQRRQVTDLLNGLKTSDTPDRAALRAVQPWTTTLRRDTTRRPEVAALCRPILGDLVEWVGAYDQRGMVLEPTGQEFIA
jgi:CRISPR-associated endonuclease/helicase Cas3